MQLTLKTLKGEKFVVNAEETNTIAEVKTIVENEKSELPAASMKLIHSGKVLKDTQTVAECNLKPNAFLVVMVSKVKSKKTPAPSPAPATDASSSNAAAAASDNNVSTATPVAASDTTETTSAETAVAAPSIPAVPPPAADDNLPAEAVANLIAMGFPEAEVRACLRAAQGNADVAVEFLMNGIPDYAQQAAAASDSGGNAGNATSSPSSSTEPLAQLRNHPQINDLRRLVQGNPSTLQAVLTQIGQQQPELLQEINSNQELFLQIMNEPVTSSGADNNANLSSSNPLSGNSSSASPSGGSSAAAGPGGLPAEMLTGMGNPAQLAQMIDGMSPEQLQSMAAMMGLTPEQLRNTAAVISRMPPEELQNFMQMAMQAEGMDGMPGMMGGGGGPPPGAQVLRLTPEEMAAVDRLAGMGFDRAEAAQAYIACDKNEELAANLLMDGGFGFGDSGVGGTGGGNDGDDMYD